MVQRKRSKLRAVFFVALGGALGSLSRFGLSLVFPNTSQGTLAANLIGVSLACFFLVLMERRGITELRWFLLPGFCGGMTTFSAVTVEVAAPDGAGFTYLFLTIFFSLVVGHLTMLTSRKVVRQR